MLISGKAASILRTLPKRFFLNKFSILVSVLLLFCASTQSSQKLYFNLLVIYYCLLNYILYLFSRLSSITNYVIFRGFWPFHAIYQSIGRVDLICKKKCLFLTYVVLKLKQRLVNFDAFIHTYIHVTPYYLRGRTRQSAIRFSLKIPPLLHAHIMVYLAIIKNQHRGTLRLNFRQSLFLTLVLHTHAHVSNIRNPAYDFFKENREMIRPFEGSSSIAHPTLR